jgi:glycosidase
MLFNPDINDFSGKLARRLQSIYPSHFSESYVNRIISLVERQYPAVSLWDERDVILITYGDTITSPGEKPLVTLHRFLEDRLNSIISTVHLLPFFPSTSDDGFAVRDFTAVDPGLGTWNDVTEIGSHFSLMFDLVLNHVSASHPWFLNYCEGRVPGKDYFIEMDPAADYHLVVRPRNTPLFTEFLTPGGKKKVWTTFSADQVDLNFSNPEVLIEMIRILILYISKGVRIIRLDAVAYLWKEKGSSCLHQRQTHEIIKLLREIVTWVNPGVILLTETNVPNAENWSYFGRQDEARMVYQFTLPPLILYTLLSGNSQYLTNWAAGIPQTGVSSTFLNFTASHDGVGIRPLEGILPEREIQWMINEIRELGGLISVKTNADGTVGPYELNIAYVSALSGQSGRTDQVGAKRFLASQLIMLAMQGIPAVYIHSLLGTEKDYEGVKQTGMPRSINRRRLDSAQLTALLETENVHALIFSEYARVLAIRRKISAFHPDSSQQILRLGDSFFGLIRENKLTGDTVYCITNITGSVQYTKPQPASQDEWHDVLTIQDHHLKEEILFEPHQTRWLYNNQHTKKGR